MHSCRTRSAAADEANFSTNPNSGCFRRTSFLATIKAGLNKARSFRRPDRFLNEGGSWHRTPLTRQLAGSGRSRFWRSHFWRSVLSLGTRYLPARPLSGKSLHDLKHLKGSSSIGISVPSSRRIVFIAMDLMLSIAKPICDSIGPKRPSKRLQSYQAKPPKAP